MGHELNWNVAVVKFLFRRLWLENQRKVRPLSVKLKMVDTETAESTMENSLQVCSSFSVHAVVIMIVEFEKRHFCHKI
jgi:hypothetical protein